MTPTPPNAVDMDLVLTYGTACGLPDGEGVVAAREVLLAHLAELRAEIARVEGEADCTRKACARFDHDARAAFAAGARVAEAAKRMTDAWFTHRDDGGRFEAEERDAAEMLRDRLRDWDALGAKGRSGDQDG